MNGVEHGKPVERKSASREDSMSCGASMRPAQAVHAGARPGRPRRCRLRRLPAVRLAAGLAMAMAGLAMAGPGAAPAQAGSVEDSGWRLSGPDQVRAGQTATYRITKFDSDQDEITLQIGFSGGSSSTIFHREGFACGGRDGRCIGRLSVTRPSAYETRAVQSRTHSGGRHYALGIEPDPGLGGGTTVIVDGLAVNVSIPEDASGSFRVGFTNAGIFPELVTSFPVRVLPVNIPAPDRGRTHVNGNTLNLVLDYPVTATRPAASAFSVTENGVSVPVNSVGGRYDTVTLTLDRAVLYGSSVRLSYTPPATNALTAGGTFGRPVRAVSNLSVNNRTTAPWSAHAPHGSSKWNATMTVGRRFVDGRGYISGSGGIGSLTRTGFSYRGVSYAVERLTKPTADSTTRLRITPALPAIALRTFELYLNSQRFSFANRASLGGGTAATDVTWNASVLDGATHPLAGSSVRVWIAGTNGAPAFPHWADSICRMRENPPAGTRVCWMPLDAVDPENEPLTYSLERRGAWDKFDFDAGTGLITPKAGVSFDYETRPWGTRLECAEYTGMGQGRRCVRHRSVPHNEFKQLYELFVRATDPDGESTTRLVRVRLLDQRDETDIEPPLPHSVRQDTEDASQYTLFFNDALLSFGPPPVSAFRVTVDGVVRALERVWISRYITGLGVALQSPHEFTDGAEVKIEYTDPTSGNDRNALQDRNGNDSPSFCFGFVVGESSLITSSLCPQGSFRAGFVNPSEPHDGVNAFVARLDLGMEPAAGFSYKVFQGDPANNRPSVLEVTNGTIVRAKRDGANQNRKWAITIQPDGDEAVTITLPATTDCDDVNAICTEDGQMLQGPITKVVPGPDTSGDQTDQTPTGLTAAYETAPRATHDGSTAFTFRFAFSQEIDPDYSYVTMRDSSLTVMQGETRLTPYVKRVTKGSNRRWDVTVTPNGNDDIAIGLVSAASCEEAGALCTEDGTLLSGTLPATTVQGPPGLSVADASVREAAGATLDFEVTLSRAASGTVTVDYATSDGTAAAGSDYTATEGTLTFAAGDVSKTVSVPVLEDQHNDDGETLTLTLSNPSGNNAWLKDATATGTIHNDDPMPRAWLARFGRTVAEQVIEAVEGRFAASRRPGVAMTLAGRAVGTGGAAPEDPESRFGDRDRSGSGAGAASLTPAGEAEARSRLADMTAWLRGAETEDGGRRAGFDSRAVTPRDLLTGTSFALTGGTKAGGTVSLWGRGAVSRFDGREGDLSLDGEVASAMMGADWVRERWTAGLLVSRSVGEGGYRGPEDGGTVESTLTGFFPYGRYEANSRVTLWGIAGYGAGELTLTPDGQAPMRTGMDLMMGAAGVRGVAVEAGPQGGFELAVKSDAMAVRTTSEKTRGLEAAEADATRLRLGLEGTWRGLQAGGGELAPRLEIGVRHDGGDAETGFGVDLGGGLSWSHPASGLSAEFSGRGLLTHESKGFRDRGLSGSFSWDPGQGSGRGPSLTLTQSVGAQASGGMDALLGRGTLAGLADDGNGGNDGLANRRLELRMGYGVSVLEDRFTMTPELSLGLSNAHREYALGWRLGLAQGGPTALELKLEATRREPAGANDNAEAVNGIQARVTARW